MIEHFDKIDKKYLKACVYAGATVIVTAVLLALIYFSGGFWRTLWSMFTAMLKPVTIGGLLAFLFLPIVRRIEKFLSKKHTKLTRSVAVGVFYLIIAAILGGLIILLYFAVRGGIESIQHMDFDSIKSFVLSLYHQYSGFIQSLQDQVSAETFPLKSISGIITAVINGIAGFISGLLFGVIFSIYFMIDEENITKYWARVIKIMHGEDGYEAVNNFMGEAERIFSGYLRGQFIDALLVGVTTGIVMTVFGVPYAIIIGLLVGLGNLIPYVGPVVGYFSVAIICLFTGEYDKLIIGVLALMIIMFIDGNIINPKLLSDSIEVHPLLVIAALIGGGAIGGFVGMIVAVPTAAFIKLQFDKYLAKREKREKLGSSEPTEKSKPARRSKQASGKTQEKPAK